MKQSKFKNMNKKQVPIPEMMKEVKNYKNKRGGK